ncbi:MAG: SDR family NAD(P)-dependent oxidoreductase [Bacteroidota bacterium]
MKDIILITGVSRKEGLGFETARQLIDSGNRVIITARDMSKVSELAKRINAEGLVVDIIDQQSINNLVEEVEKRYEKLDVLINNAGAFFDMGAQPLDVDLNFAKNAFDTNLFGAWRMIRAFIPMLRKSDNGRIVNVSSGAGSFQDPVFGLSAHQGIVPTYGLTKLALNGLTVKLARQLKD